MLGLTLNIAKGLQKKILIRMKFLAKKFITLFRGVSKIKDSVSVQNTISSVFGVFEE